MKRLVQRCGWLQNANIGILAMTFLMGAIGTTLGYGLPNRAPIADAGGVYEINEGDSLVLDGSLSRDPDGDALTATWDLNDDGVYGDALGTNAVVGWSALSGLGLVADGDWHAIWIKVTDGRGGTNENYSFLMIDNLPPVANAGGAYTNHYGEALTL
ncbi:MAG: PKD domain-containing protein, partial [bacterium]